jgi:hypothetical protein
MAAVKVDILVNLLTALQPFAGNVTTLPLNDADQPLDYSRLIGGMVVDHENRLSQLISSLNTLYSTVTSLSGTVSLIPTDVVPKLSLPALMGDSSYYAIQDITSELNDQFLELRNILSASTIIDLSNSLIQNTQLDGNLSSKTALNPTNRSITMSELTGWQASPTTVGKSLQNMWITINDMRMAVEKLVGTSAVVCGDITINYTYFLNPEQATLTLYFLGNCTIPSGFTDVDSRGGLLTITDNASPSVNTYSTYINVVNAANNPSGVVINLVGTGINPYLTLSSAFSCNLTNGYLQCAKTVTTKTGIVGSYDICAQLTIIPSTTSISVLFTPSLTTNVVYTVNVYNNVELSGTPTKTFSRTNPATTVSQTITGLTTATPYWVRLTVVTSGVTYNCNAYPINTI